MNLAKIENDGELRNLLEITNGKPTLFSDEFFIESSSGSADFPCFTYKMSFRGNFAIYNVESSDQQSKFLCENVEIKDYSEIVRDEVLQDSVDVKSTIFRPVGDYDNAEDVLKNYYLSSPLLTPPEASVVCKSFGMILASPEDQQEFDNLVAKMPSMATIAAYRSESDDNVWLDGYGNAINYNFVWTKGSASNSDGHCVEFEDGPKESVSMPCDSKSAFICEENLNEVKTETQFNSIDASKFMSNFFAYQTEHISVEFFPSKASVKLSLFEAKLVCESYGMQLYAPEDGTSQLEMANDFFNNLGYTSAHIGLTKIGKPDSWYSIVTGKILDEGKIQYAVNDSDDFDCLAVAKGDDETWFTQINDCNRRMNFVCQKLTPIDSLQYEFVDYDNSFEDDVNSINY